MSTRCRMFLGIVAGFACLQVAARGQVSEPRPGPASQPAVATHPAVAASRPATQPAASQPALLRVDSRKFDFGRIWDTDKVEHTFQMTNTGTRPVAILGVDTTCGCTKSQEYQKQVAPGEKWELPIEFTARGNRPGKTDKSITVKTDDPGNPRVVFQLEGEIALRLDVQPSRAVMFGTLQRDAAAHKTLTITNPAPEPVTLKNPKADIEQLKVSLREIEAGRKYELDVDTVPPLTVASLMGKVTVETDLKALPELSIAVLGNVQQRVSLAPPLVMVPQPLESELSRKLVVKSAKDVTFHVKDATASDPKVQVKIETVREGAEYNVWVTVPAGISLAARSETITITTDDPEMPTLTATLRSVSARASGNPLATGKRPVVKLVPTTRPSFRAPLRLPDAAPSQPR